MRCYFRKGTYIEESYYPLSPVVKVYDKSKNVVFKVYSWGRVEKVKEGDKIAGARLYTGTKWVSVSFKKLGQSTVNKLIKGRTSFLFKKIMKDMK